MFLFQLRVDDRARPTNWTRDVVSLLQQRGVRSAHASFVTELESLDRMCSVWLGRYGPWNCSGTAHVRSSESEDKMRLLLPAVERLTHLHLAGSAWGLHIKASSAVGLKHIRLGGDGEEHCRDADTPLHIAAALLMDDASRSWSCAAGLLSPLRCDDRSAPPNPTILSSRSKEAFRHFQEAYACACGVLALPLVDREMRYDATRLRDCALACAAAAQYLFAATREGSSTQNRLLSGLAAHAANTSYACRWYGSEWEAVIGHAFDAVSLKHRAEAELASNPGLRDVPNMPLVLGCLSRAKSLIDSVLQRQSSALMERRLLSCVLPTAALLQAEISSRLATAERENALVYHAKAFAACDIPAIDTDKHATAPTTMPLYNRVLEWSDMFEACITAARDNIFVRLGPTEELTRPKSPPSAEPDGSDHGAFEDVLSPEEALRRLFKSEVPSAVSAVTFAGDADQKLLIAVQNAVQSCCGTLRLPHHPHSSEQDIHNAPWLLHLCHLLSDLKKSLGTELDAVHDQRTRLITANVQRDHSETMRDVTNALEGWLHACRALLKQPYTPPTTPDKVSSSVFDVANRFFSFATMPPFSDNATWVLLAALDDMWASLLTGTYNAPSILAADVSAAECASYKKLLARACSVALVPEESTTVLVTIFDVIIRGAECLLQDMQTKIDEAKSELATIKQSGAFPGAAPVSSASPPSSAPPAGGPDSETRVGSRLQAMLKRKRPRED